MRSEDDPEIRELFRRAGAAAADDLIAKGMTPPQSCYDLLADFVRRRRRLAEQRQDEPTDRSENEGDEPSGSLNGRV